MRCPCWNAHEPGDTCHLLTFNERDFDGAERFGVRVACPGLAWRERRPAAAGLATSRVVRVPWQRRAASFRSLPQPARALPGSSARQAETCARSLIARSPIRVASRASSVVTLLTRTTQACDKPPRWRSEIGTMASALARRW